MDRINDIFANLANKLPFAQQFFSRNVAIGPLEFNTLFLILVGIILLVLLVIIIAVASKSGSKKQKASQPTQQPAELERAEATPVAASETAVVAAEVAPIIIAEETFDKKPEDPIAEKKEPERKIESVQKAEPAPKAVSAPKAKPITVIKETPAEQTAKQEKTVDKPVSSEPLRLFKSQKVQPAAAPAPKPQAQAEPKVKEQKEPEAVTEALAAKDDTKKTSGKFETVLKSDGYRFYLVANNGQLLFESIGYTSANGAQKGIDTFKKAVESGSFVVDEDKFGRFRFILNRRYAGENYSTKAACESSIESVKNFSKTAAILPYEYDDAAEKKYAESKNAIIATVDWDAVEKEDSAKKPSGKFEIVKRADGYHYYLLANNGQLLFSSNGYASASYAKEAIQNFKKAVYIGNFMIDEDKFGRFRFILRGAGFSTAYVGESYTTRAACEKIINSVKNFSRTAVIA